MKEKTVGFIAKEHGGTVYIAECVPSDAEKDTAYDKVRRLIMNDRKALKNKAAS